MYVYVHIIIRNHQTISEQKEMSMKLMIRLTISTSSATNIHQYKTVVLTIIMNNIHGLIITTKKEKKFHEIENE